MAIKNKKSGNYRFGFTTFEHVGCEVASVYNAMIALRHPEMLSETIYCFEAWAIELSIGWGNLGSEPWRMYRYFEKKGIEYEKYTSYSSLEAVVDSKSRCYIIMSRWNADPTTTGLHTFYIYKAADKVFNSYNWRYSSESLQRETLSTFNDGSGFIVGYILYK